MSIRAFFQRIENDYRYAAIAQCGDVGVELGKRFIMVWRTQC